MAKERGRDRFAPGVKATVGCAALKEVCNRRCEIAILADAVRGTRVP